ncbi:NAD(P)-dependent oxidoreductase [Goodfellowiella coeruleoviolacea]|uniref:NAD(P)-binding domain-containing protein n=1 Tax=Goodfellowiella coeruleoviolacea TaxID=334858 RepID=A0AAE3GK12_9PSEU|nr:NAD(P)H-binding protein [Goodfellowiella coeruleoviolacea]MCP2168837.1 hypothetical protein [Goodfellowiella coeruleoviolacea]
MSGIVVFGAGGRAGRQVVAEARGRGHQVTAVVRDPAKYAELAGAGVRVEAGDVTDGAAVADLVAGHDAVVSMAAVYGPGTNPPAFFVDSTRALLAGVARAGIGRLVVGGLGALLPDDTGTRFVDAMDLPAEAREFCLAHAAGLDVLRAEGDAVDWLYLSPCGDFDHDGARTGGYRVGERADMANRISYADFAIAVLDEVDTPQHHRTHLGVLG